jgi:PAS domain S-box-containing protein
MFQSILDAVPQAMFWKDLDGRYGGCNAAFLRIAGLPRSEEVVGRDDFQMPWGEELAHAYRAVDQSVIASGQPSGPIEEHLIDAAGKQIWLETTKAPLRDAHGRIIGILGTFQDITRKRTLERELATSKLFQQGVMDSFPGMLFLIDAQGRLVFWTRRTEALTGYDHDDLAGMELTRWFREPAEVDQVRLAMQRMFADGHGELETTLTRRDGLRVPFYLSGARITLGDLTYITGIGLDITERWQAELALRRSEQRYQAIFDASPVLISLHDMEDDTFLDANPKFCQAVGLPREQLIGMAPMEPWGVVGTNPLTEVLQRLHRGETIDEYECSLTTERGGQRNFLVSSRVIAPEGRNLLLVLSVDITDRKRIETELRQIKDYVVNVLESMPTPLLGFDERGLVTQWNRAAGALFGVTAGEALGRPILELASTFAPWIAGLIRESECTRRPAALEKLALEW